MHRTCVCALSLLLIGSVGCQTTRLLHESWPEARPLGAAMQTYRAPQGEPHNDPLPPDPTGDITLADAMAMALLRSPELRSYAYDVRAAEARMLQAGRWSNPELEVEVENLAGTGVFSGVDAAEVTISLAQTFPLGGDIDARRAVAGFEAKLLGWDYEAARVQLLAEVTMRYVEVLAAQRQVQTASDALTWVEQVRQMTQRRIDAGDAPHIELARASVPVVTAQVELRRAQRAHASARKQLAMTWGGAEVTFGAVHGDLDRLAPLPSAEALSAMVTDNPQVARWATHVSLANARMRLARAEASPDVTGRLGYRFDNDADDSALVAGISLPLPLVDRRLDDIDAARLDAMSAHERRAAAQRMIEAALAQAYTQLADAHDEASALRDEALPPATQAFEITRNAFEQGDLTFIDVLDAQRTLIELRHRYVAALRAHHTAAAQIEGLLGAPLASVRDEQPPSALGSDTHETSDGEATP